MTTFSAYQVEKEGDTMSAQIVTRDTEALPQHNTLIEVLYSSVNYKDALSANGAPGVTRSYPHTPGIDAAGIVVKTEDPQLKVGDEVIVIGFDLGMNTPGGYGQYISVPGEWVTPLPAGLSLRESMILGTAGLTAALCVEKLLWMNASPEQGPVIVTGATGGVGSVAVALLANLGFEVVASSGKADQTEFLSSLGASQVIHRDELSEPASRPLLAPRFAHGIDAGGGDTLSNVIKQLEPQGSVAVCGLVASPEFAVNVFPFILRGVNVLGVDSVELPLADKTRNWVKLAEEWHLSNLDELANEISLGDLDGALASIYAGGVVGRTLVNVQTV